MLNIPRLRRSKQAATALPLVVPAAEEPPTAAPPLLPQIQPLPAAARVRSHVSGGRIRSRRRRFALVCVATPASATSCLPAPSESQVQAGADGAGGFGQRVLPVLLGRAAHQQQAAAGQVEAKGGGRVPGRGRSRKRRVAPRLSEAMAGAGPSSGSSSACQPMLSRPSRYRFSSTLLKRALVAASTRWRRRVQGGQPGAGLPGQARVGVAGLGFAVPGREARLRHFLPKQADGPLLPGHCRP